MSNPRQSLAIAWIMPVPPVKAVTWFRWDDPISPAAIEPDDTLIEQELAWPPHTIAALRLGFQRHLARSCGWETAKKLSLAAASPYLKAATIFKRGADHRTESEKSGAPTEVRGHYNILIHHHSPGSSDDAIPASIAGSTDFLIIDARVAAAWPQLANHPHRLIIPTNEHEKSLATVAKILAAWNGQQALVAIGGGILCDIAGFAASLRRAPIRFVPTTLLAMADACVGGKTGVNFSPFGKNQIGAFYFPTQVDVWPAFLSTLPLRELRAGGAECLKHALLAGNQELAHKLTEALAQADIAALAALLPDVITYKADVVAEDPVENGRRATLNFGHTLAHALETLSQKATKGETTLLHGEAVAIGMVFAIVLSRRVAGLGDAEAKHMLDQLSRAQIVPPAASLAAALDRKDLKNKKLFTDLRALIGHDKKSTARNQAATDWILLGKGGRVHRPEPPAFTASVFDQELVSAWTDFLRYYSDHP